MLFVPVTVIEPVLVRVPARSTGLLGDVVVAKVSEPELVTVPARFRPYCVGVACSTLPVKSSVRPDPVKFDKSTAPAPEPVKFPENVPLRMTVAPVPALTMPGPPLPPPMIARVPELLWISPESFTGNQTSAVPVPVVRSKLPALLNTVPVCPLV